MKKIKTSVCVEVYNVLKNAALGKMESNDKFNVIKSIRVMKQVADEFESFRDSAREKLQGENHEDMMKLADQWRKEGDEKTSLTIEQRIAVNQYFDKYGRELEQCLAEEADKEHELDIRTISESAFAKLIEANDRLTVEQIMLLQDVFCE